MSNPGAPLYKDSNGEVGGFKLKDGATFDSTKGKLRMRGQGANGDVLVFSAAQDTWVSGTSIPPQAGDGVVVTSVGQTNIISIDPNTAIPTVIMDKMLTGANLQSTGQVSSITFEEKPTVVAGSGIDVVVNVPTNESTVSLSDVAPNPITVAGQMLTGLTTNSKGQTTSVTFQAIPGGGGSATTVLPGTGVDVLTVDSARARGQAREIGDGAEHLVLGVDRAG